ncbi:hypothetical protein CTheo_3598 [Ceratobasidium theobromae]|uniref:Uncharacterized protein n=1 Tax=Ceratobasidium theobromae TaxID=1582974 RepID=A0A5N5QN20_9AGAM|nr:hypothetical protein CTheo_3598 [Ceratobasidium theobromae]
MMTLVRAPQPPPAREPVVNQAFQDAVDRFLATKNQPFTVSGTIPTNDPLTLFFQAENGTSYSLRLPLEDEYGTSPAFDALVKSCEPEERFVPPARTDSAPPVRSNVMPTPRQPYATFTSPSSPMVGPGAVVPAGTVLYPSPPPAAIVQAPGALLAGQFIPPHRRSLVFPSGRPVAVSLELSSHPVLDIVKATLFPKLPQGYHLLAVRDKLHIHPSGTYTRPVHDAVFPEGVVATIMVTLPVHYRGGTLVVGCEGKEERFYGRLGSKSNELEWQAWRTNCDWEVQKVEKGHRVAMTWHVYQRSYGPSSHPLMVPNDALLDALADLLNHGRGKNLGFFLSHEYGVSPSDVLADSLAPYLKGADAILYHAVKIYKLQPQLRYCAGGFIWPVDKPALIVDSARPPQSTTPFKRAGRSRSLTRDSQLQAYQRRQEYEEDAELAEKVQRGGAVPLADENITLLHSPEQGHIAKERVPFLASDAENTLDHLYVNVVLVVFIP